MRSVLPSYTKLLVHTLYEIHITLRDFASMGGRKRPRALFMPPRYQNLQQQLVKKGHKV